MKTPELVILGAGESGTGAALLAKAKGVRVWVSDAKAIAEKYKAELKQVGVPFEEEGHTAEVILQAKEIVKSPGIPYTAPIVEQALEKQIPVIDEIEFASRYTQGKFIAITGTNGKTTTTMLTYHLMRSAGLKVGLAGNIGKSLARQVLLEKPDWWVLEVSSFQIDGFRDFHPSVTMILNITPDHLDRYHYQLDNYVHAKFNLLNNQGQEDHFIYSEDNELTQHEVARLQPQVHLHPFSVQQYQPDGAWLHEDTLLFDRHPKLKIPVSEIPLKGLHNYANVLAAAQAALIAGVAEEDLKKGLLGFSGAPHRMENVGELEGVRYINDSKATNVDAVYYALESFQTPVIWIAGGIDKGNEYAQLMPVMQPVKALICLGQGAEKLETAFEDKVSAIRHAGSMAEAVQQAATLAEAGDTVLLSPACASFDLFKNYEDRGNQFRQEVQKMKSEHQEMKK